MRAVTVEHTQLVAQAESGDVAQTENGSCGSFLLAGRGASSSARALDPEKSRAEAAFALKIALAAEIRKFWTAKNEGATLFPAYDTLFACT